MANDTLSFNVLNNSSRTIGQIQLLRALSRDTSIMDSSVVLKSFYQNSTGSQADLVNTIERELMQGGAATAQTLLTSLNSSDAVINSHKTFFAPLINMQNGTYLAADSANLYALATSCPLIYGTAVYQSRTLYNVKYHMVLPFENNCPLLTANARSINSSLPSDGKNTLFIYPNPSSGELFISGIDLNSSELLVEINDLSGRVIAYEKILSESGIARINVDLNNGVYLIKVTSSDSSMKMQKIIIHK